MTEVSMDESFSSQRFLLNSSSIQQLQQQEQLQQSSPQGKQQQQGPLPLQDEQKEGKKASSGGRFKLATILGQIGMRYSALAGNKSSLPSPSSTFRRLAAAREMASLQTRSSNSNSDEDEEGYERRRGSSCSGSCGRSGSGGMHLREGVHLPVLGDIRWETMKSLALTWLKDPKNLALLGWTLAVAISGAILFMVMTGMLNAAIPTKSARDAWFEVNNQILNALFTLMCLYLHPQRFLHLYQLVRWSRKDILALRRVYCKHGSRKPHEWAHILVVVLLLHLNCFSQYALCGLNWGFKRSERPAVGVGVCLAFAIGAAAAAGVYNTLSPLGRDYIELKEEDRKMEEMESLQQVAFEEDQRAKRKHKRWSLLEKRRSFALRGESQAVEHPEWRGGLFDCCMDREVAILSTACSFCVFGWNMDRLGFGNRFVHIATFLLICTAPYWIFLLAAGNIDNEKVKQGLGISGILLSIFGLMYGGFWRIRMRATYSLPAQTWCCGQPNATDCTQWMFCSLCSLCQEVRTASYYDIRDAKFYEPTTKTTERNGAATDAAAAAAAAAILDPMTPSSPGPLTPLGRERACQVAPSVNEMRKDGDDTDLDEVRIAVS